MRRIPNFLIYTIKFLSLLFSVTALFAVIWIVIPAPAYYFWLLSVVTSEWSLEFGTLALLGVLFGFFWFQFAHESRKFSFFSIVTGAAAILISLYPLGSAFLTAQKENASLSFGQYVSGLRSETNSDSAAAKSDFTTQTFASVEGNALEMDIYLPPNDAESRSSGVIVVHGGSWNAGARNDFPQWNRWLAEQGFAVFDIDYRLAPQPNWQTATGDVKCAIVWIKRHASEFGISPKQLSILGRSAGGHLALLAAYTANDERFPPGCHQSEAENNLELPANLPQSYDESVRAVASLYAPTDLLWDFENPANQFVIDGPATLRHFVGGSPTESVEINERFSLASPTSHVTAQSPPTMLVHGGQDQLVRRENVYLLGEKLKKSNVPHKIVFIGYAQHGFDFNFNGWGSQIVQHALLQFLDENTKEQK
jgi:acetyl esterase/lipase